MVQLPLLILNRLCTPDVAGIGVVDSGAGGKEEESF